LAPGHFVLVDQFIDRTFAREKSFFGDGLVGHVSVADPVSPLLVDALEKAAKAEKIAHTRGGTYLVMEGPQFSTRAESTLYRAWGASVIGMTNMPEAKLAREAEISYATIAMVTDYDCWRSDTAHVDVAEVIRVLHGNVAKAQKLIARLARDFPREHPKCPIGSDTALDVAIMTAPDKRDPALVKKCEAILMRLSGTPGSAGTRPK
jgi:5'-methylthioadenosine phosphorylase